MGIEGDEILKNERKIKSGCRTRQVSPKAQLFNIHNMSCCASSKCCQIEVRRSVRGNKNRPFVLMRASGDPYAAPFQLHGSRAGEKRENASPGRLLPCSRGQQHAAQLLRERCDNPAGPRGPRRLALRRERKDPDVSATRAQRCRSHFFSFF